MNMNNYNYTHAQPAWDLEPALSLQDGASNFSCGECILVRIPELEGHIADEACAVILHGIAQKHLASPTTSNGTSGHRQHLAFVRTMQIRSEDSWTLEVYPILSFSESAMRSLSDTAKALLLPLSKRRPTPDAFGPPLDLGNWSTNTSMRDSFLHVIPKRFVMPTSRPFKRMNPPLSMSSSMLYRIDRYRETLNSNTQSVTSSLTIIGDGEGEKAAGAELLVLESVDEDAQDANATLLDELKMLAHGDPIWMKELRKHLKILEKEREEMMKERAVRLARWREGVVQPT